MPAPDVIGRFAGKIAFGSANGAPLYLTTIARKRSGHPPLMLPGMSAPGITAAERCILYGRKDGTIALQLGGLLWVALDEELGWLTTTADPASAASLTLSGSPVGQLWKVATSGGPADVSYTAGGLSPLLTIDGPAGTFAPAVVTPSLDEIVRAPSVPGADLADVDLRGAAFGAVGLPKASLARARLDGCSFSGDLQGAVFDEATVGSATFDGAVLDGASFVGASLVGAAWGAPKSAKGIVLTGCRAAGAVLGGQPSVLDCTGATLSGGDYRGANLRGLQLSTAKAGGAIMSGCQLDEAVLDGADLAGVIAVGATLTGAKLRGTSAYGASFAHADLSNADLTRAQMGARAYLFTLPATFADELDADRFAQPDLVRAFAKQGVTISADDDVKVVTVKARWQLADPHGPYDLVLNASGAIDVFSASPTLRPAVLRRAICAQTQAAGAGLSGADLRGVSWYGPPTTPASLDHADLEDAALDGAYLAGTDFTQAYLAGADMSGAVLVQSKLRGCHVGAGSSRRPFSLEGALLHQADFTDAKLLGALLVDAAVAEPRGVPLFSLPLSAASQLTSDGLSQLAPLFTSAGRPLGSAPDCAQRKDWLLDNSANSTPGMPAAYRVHQAGQQLVVFDAAGGPRLFILQANAAWLGAPTASPALVSAFDRNGQYTLASNSPISAQQYWEITVDSDAAATSVATYGLLRVYPDAAALPVYGAVLVTPHGWPAHRDDLAFGPTVGLTAALDPASLGPSGAPRAWVDAGRMTFEQLLTAPSGQP